MLVKPWASLSFEKETTPKCCGRLAWGKRGDIPG